MGLKLRASSTALCKYAILVLEYTAQDINNHASTRSKIKRQNRAVQPH